MRLGYFADGPWAHRALQSINADGRFEIAFLVLRHGSADPVLSKWADQHNVPCYVVPNVNLPEFIGIIADHRAELFVSMSFDQILRKEIREAAPLGFINCHAGALPFYRGRNVLNWALINGEDTLGITVHDVDDGIDTGDIITQIFVDIVPDDDYGTMLEKAYEACPRALIEALGSYVEGTVRRRKQAEIHPVGFYCPRRTQGDELLQWNQPSLQVVNFVRGLALPGPGARAFIEGSSYAVLKASLIPRAPTYIATPGAIVGRDAAGIIVKTLDTTIHIRSVAKIIDGRIGEPEAPRFAIGRRFTDEMVPS